ncbi:mitochondrial carrier [Cladochytrium replicatum]|nr:mitochondrial carrier [Cladochytrium replicatum]
MSDTEIVSVEDPEYESLPDASVTMQMVAGACAGITEHTFMYPIDAIKTRMQVFTSNPQAIYSSMGAALKRISTTEGVLTLYRGVTSVMVGAGPAHALYFSTYEQCKKVFGANGEGHHPIASAAAGACATIASDGLMNPFDVVKQRMQVHGSTYRSMIDCFKSVVRTEGVGALYISYPTTLTMTIPFQSIHFASYEYFRKTLNPSGQYAPWTHITAGGLAGALAAAATTPLDVAKTLLQTRGTSTDPVIRNARGMLDAIGIIWKRQGINGFFRGLQPRIFSHMPATAICWTTYEFLKHLMQVQSYLVTKRANVAAAKSATSSPLSSSTTTPPTR